jgi:hypothetical protein
MFDLSFILQIVGGAAGLYGLTELVKFLPFIPINDGQKTKIRAWLGVSAASVSFVLALLNPDVDPSTLQGLLMTLISAVGMAFGAHGIHRAAAAVKS